MKFPKKYSSPEAAEREFCEEPMETDAPLSVEPVPTTPLSVEPVPTNKLMEMVMLMPVEDQLKAISDVFCYFADVKCSVNIPSDFLQLVISASQHLLQNGRSNVVYGITKAIGTKRSDGSDSRLPAKRMPMGLLEHTANFFNSDSYTKVLYKLSGN